MVLGRMGTSQTVLKFQQVPWYVVYIPTSTPIHKVYIYIYTSRFANRDRGGTGRQVGRLYVRMYITYVYYVPIRGMKVSLYYRII